jgi:hypothetical protein
MALSLIDLRRVALGEYPEFGVAPWPVPWYRNFWSWVGVAGLATWLALFGVLLSVVL